MQEYENCIFEMANHLNQKCNISDFCANQFSKERYNGSNLLKQAFYYLATRSVRIVSSNDIIIFWETIDFMPVKGGQFSQSRLQNRNTESIVDVRISELLFVVYGGLGGYLQMAHPVMMDEIMSWQDESGCFKIVKKNEPVHSDLIHFEREVQLKDGCLLRLTSMAAAALAMHIGRFSIGEVYKPDFHYILHMENTLAQNKYVSESLLPV
ncbi:unnamed protein product [Rodentolepis nana]|uniref:Anaphase-promoting complex subunit 1 n=1 Tax=Rodentolepis nana TaxID=102285 RepID=A0A0R3TT30_RODNA|nr:unnamed protein product [Rodentolepis nana]